MSDIEAVSVEAIEQRLCTFLTNDLEWEGDPATLVGAEPVTLPSMLDSEELLEMVTFLEDEYGIEVDDEEISPENFNTVPSVAAMVSAKLAAG